jgi:hypothetical protein
MKILKRLSTAFHPEMDGSIERMNQELEAYLRYFVSYYQDDWKQLLFIATLAINGRISSVTGFSPFFAIHNYDIKPIVAAVAQQCIEEGVNLKVWVETRVYFKMLS